MKEEHAVVHIHVADCCAGFAVGAHVGKLKILPEGLSGICGADSARDVELLGNDVVPDAVYCIDISLVSGEGGDVGHSGIHVGGPYGMTHGFVLFKHGKMGLVIFVAVFSLSALVQEELGFVQVLLFTGCKVELGKGHFGNLVTGDHAGLSGTGAHFTYHAVCVLDCDVQEIALAGGLVMGDGALYHVAKVVELVAQFLVLDPAAVSGPLMGMLRIHGAGGVKVTVGFLGCGHYCQDAVYICLQFFVGVGLEHIGSAFYGFVDIGVVKGVSLHFVAKVYRGMHLFFGFHKVLIAALGLTFGEGEGDGHLTGSLETLAPEGVLLDFHAGKGHRVYGITGRRRCGF